MPETPHTSLRALAAHGTVLVVDDEDSVRQLIAVTLELEGYQVLQAADGATALDLARRHHLDLVTLDVMMPGMDGWQVADALDADPVTAAVPRVMVSGVPIADLERAPGRQRAAAVLAKPFDLATFVEVVSGLAAVVRVPAQRMPAAQVALRG